MIDTLVILFSVGMCVLVAWLAVRLDAVLPWFDPGTPPEPDAQAEAGMSHGWRARRHAPR